MKWQSVALSLAVGACAHAGLVFESDVVRETAAPNQDTFQSKFQFKVEGDKPITIKEVQTTCGCLSAAADKSVYQPGESGTVSAVIRLGSFDGEVAKSVYVISDDPGSTKHQLQMRITIPKVMEILPEVTTWQVGEKPVTRNVTIKILSEEPFEIKGVSTERKKFALALKEIVKGREYEVAITPETTAEPTLGAIKIMTTSTIPRYQNRLVFFNVVRPRASALRPVPAPSAGAPPPPVVTPPVLAPRNDGSPAPVAR